MKKIPLIHPIYLDVPMLVSFAAAVQGGLALEAEVTEETKVRIVGKITRSIKEGDVMSSFENYGMAMLKPQMLNDMFSQITNAENFVAEFTDIQVQGPALQILPLMIFV